MCRHILVNVAADRVQPAELSTGRKEQIFYLTMHSTHFIYAYMVSDIG